MTYADIQIRIRAPRVENAPVRVYPVEAFWNGAGPWRGDSEFDFSQLDAGLASPEAYGVALGKALLNPIVLDALQRAGLSSGAPCRVRLLLDEESDVPHSVRWERIYVPIGNASRHLASSPTSPFARYVAVRMPDLPPAEIPLFRVLLAIASPTNLGEAAIDVNKEITALVEEFEAQSVPPRLHLVVMAGVSGILPPLAARLQKLGWQIVGGNTSAAHIAATLEREKCHGFHILCHGEFRAGRGEGLLFLEAEADGTSVKVADTDLHAWVKPEIRLALFQACRTAAVAPKDEPPFVGVAYRMVGLGVPAVVAMQDYVGMEDARAFVSGFYRSLLDDGMVDVAANAGRRAIAARGGDPSIPALFLRLQGGQLLMPDPVREAVLHTRRRIAQDGAFPDAMPLRAVDHVHGVQYRPGIEPEGVVLRLDDHFLSLAKRHSLVILTGAPGSNKTEQFQRLYCQLADEFLAGATQFAPVWMRLRDLSALANARWHGAEEEAGQPRLLSCLQAVARREPIPALLHARRFHLVVQVNEDPSPAVLDAAMRALGYLLAQLPDCHLLLIFDHDLLASIRRYQWLAEAKLLVVRPLDPPSVRAYLLQTSGRPERQQRSDQELAGLIESSSLEDIASAPWLLSEMRELHRQGDTFRCRAQLLRLVAERYLAIFGGQDLPRCCADDSLQAIAWQLQMGRRWVMEPPMLWEVLADARDGREFQLQDLRENLIRCGILSRTGDEGVRFSYPAIQDYFAALWLYHCPDMGFHLGDITATLGRFSRLRHWQGTLVVLAGMLESVTECQHLLEVLLSGSSLSEGSQVHLAARLLTEMRESLGATSALTLSRTRVVKQIVDTLVWRSSPVNGASVSSRGTGQFLVPARPYQDRRRSLEALVSLRHPGTLEHLVAIAFDPVGADLDDREQAELQGAIPRFDVSGARMLAAAGLLQQLELTEEYFRKHRPELLPLSQAWKEYLSHGTEKGLLAIMNQNDPACSPVAVFAYAYGGWEIPEGHPLFAAQWNRTLDIDVRWAVTEMFGRHDAKWVAEHVVEARLAKRAAPDPRLCYLIQKTAIAPPGSKQREYLYRAMRDSRVVHRALRAFAKLQDPEVSEWLRELCHQILRGQWRAATQSKRLALKKTPDERTVWSLRHSALEALRDVGDLPSIDVIRDMRIQLDSSLSLLSFQVAEEIYWRATGGLARERY